MLPARLSPEYRLGLQFLKEEPRTAQELQELLGVASRTVRKYLKLWREDKRIYRYNWLPTRTEWTPVYAILTAGCKDKPKPKAQTKAEKSKKYRANNQLRLRVTSCKRLTNTKYAQLYPRMSFSSTTPTTGASVQPDE